MRPCWLRPRPRRTSASPWQSAVQDYRFPARLAQVTLAAGETIRAPLVVAADAATRRLARCRIKLVGWPYDQTGIVVTVAHERPHHGRAEEHFTPSGPLRHPAAARKPRVELVWSERQAEAQRSWRR